MARSIVRYMLLGDQVWVYLDDKDIRLATGPEVARIIEDDPEFALHFSLQNANHVPKAKDCDISLDDIKIPN